MQINPLRQFIAVRSAASALPRGRGTIAPLLLIAVAQLGCGRAGRDDGSPPTGLVAALARENVSAGATGPRFSVGSVRAHCSVHLARGACNDNPVTLDPVRFTDVAARAARELRSGTDPEALHAIALVDLLSAGDSKKTVERSISTLQTAARLSDRPAPMLADLAGAYLLRAERWGSPRDLLSAIEAAEEALRQDPANRVALYDRALALQRFGLTMEAGREWRTYLEVDSMSEWGAQARLQARMGALAEAPPRVPRDDAATVAFAAYAVADPQGARELGWDRLLGAWAEAELYALPARADSILVRAAALGDALERRPGGDATLADAVRAIRSTAGAGRQRLAEAHREYSDGRALYEAAEFGGAVPHFARAVSRSGRSPALRRWARLFMATALAHRGAPRAERLIRAVVDDADTARYPALAARARWSLTSTLVRSDRYEPALAPGAEAVRFFRRAGEREAEGAVLQVLSDAQFALGELDAAYASAFKALAVLRPFRGSVRLHNLLFALADNTASDGFRRAAVRIQDEGVEAATRNGNPAFIAEARLGRARLLAGAGDLERARGEAAAGVSELGRVRYDHPRSWLESDLRYTEALTAPVVERARDSAALDSAAAFYLSRRSPLRAFPVVVSAAEARLTVGDLGGATSRLEAAMAMLAQRRDSIRMEPRRAAVFESARKVVDRLVMVKLATGDVAGALRYMDRARASLAPVGRPSGRRSSRPNAIGNEVAVEYALVDDTLLAWTVERGRETLYRARVDTLRLARTIAGVRSSLERWVDSTEADSALAELYRELIQPLRLGPPGTPVVVVADGELAGVPFAALRDARRGRYLVEDHPLRWAVSLEYDRETPRRKRGPGGVVIIADPAFDPAEHPGLTRLTGALAEAREVAADYPGARIVEGARATRAAVREALEHAAVVHYAGHAVFDDDRPERSYLVLAPAGKGDGGTFTAGELARLRLTGTPTVVLAACGTVSSGRGRAAGFTGLAGALLSAGAGGVVGGLWEVDDGLTRPLMSEFHRAYRALGDGPAALRNAQLALIHSQDPALRSPAAWAGFRYAGR